MSNFTFETGEVPENTNGRPSEPNPFMPDGKNLMAEHTKDNGKSLNITLDGSQESNKDALNKLTSQARKAAKAANLTGRVKVSETGKGKDAKTKFTAWSVPPITRPRKTDAVEGNTEGNVVDATDDAVAASAANPNTATE